MTPSFEFFDIASSRRAYLSAADQERAGYMAEITHASAFQTVRYDSGIGLESDVASPRMALVGMG